MAPKLCKLKDNIDNQLWWIRTDRVAKARVSGMTGKCLRLTVDEVIASPGWKAETKILEGATEALMVSERFMLEPMVEDTPGAP